MDGTNHDGASPQPTDESLLTGTPTEGADDSSQGGGAGEETPPEPPKWVHQLNGDLKANEKVTGFQNLNDLVADYLSYAEKAERLVELPGDDADEQARQEFFNKLRPEKPEDYQFEEFELPQGMGYDKESEAEFRNLAHQLGLTIEQAKELHKWDTSRVVGRQQAYLNAQKEAIEALKKEWGDDFEGNINEVQRAFKQIAAKLDQPELAARMVEKGYGNDPDMIRAFHGIWQMIKDDNMPPGGPAADEKPGVAETWYPNTVFE